MAAAALLLLLPLLAGAAGSCSGGREPLLWRAQLPGDSPYTAYLVGSHGPSSAEVAKEVREALGCADVALFRLACSGWPFGGLGHFLDHCSLYGATEVPDSIAARLGTEEVTALQLASRSLLQRAPAECRGSRAWAEADKAVLALNATGRRTTLQAFYQMMTAAVNPSSCAAREDGSQSSEDLLRSVFGSTKPTFGLVDVDEECQLTRHAAESEEKSLARQMARDFGNSSWLEERLRATRLAADAMECGDLAALTPLMERAGGDGRIGSLQELPWHNRAGQNPYLVESILHAKEQHPQRVAVVVLDAIHLVDASLVGIKGVHSLLRERGFVVERMRAGADLSCAPSSHAADGALQRDECLMPPRMAQRDSCVNFHQAWSELTSHDAMWGRIKTQENCNKCQVAETQCSCEFTWKNDSAFTDLCENTFVDGTYGRVIMLDATRNPGLTRNGSLQAEKFVKSLGQNCYAASCEVELLQMMAQRRWYSTDSSLVDGVIDLRCPDGASDCLTEAESDRLAVVRVLRDNEQWASGAGDSAETEGALLMTAMRFTLAGLVALLGLLVPSGGLVALLISLGIVRPPWRSASPEGCDSESANESEPDTEDGGFRFPQADKAGASEVALVVRGTPHSAAGGSWYLPSNYSH